MPDLSSQTKPWLVLKFGGTSVSTLERWRTIASILRDRIDSGYRVVVVCSAISQATNRLESLLATAEQGVDFTADLRALEDAHAELAESLGLQFDDEILNRLHSLRTSLQGVRLTLEATPRLRARVLATGEMLSTRIGYGWLLSQGIEACWHDARELLVAEPEPIISGQPASGAETQFLHAQCTYEHDEELLAKLNALPGKVVITQGFIARLPDGLTVLLGRGGSDTSASYFAARLGAEHLEIWTDVPGMFTANPKHIEAARLLRRLSYAEASELASKGAKVLHPHCIAPAAAHGIPIHIRCTPRPELEGSVIGPTLSPKPCLRAVTLRNGLVVVSMDTGGSWQQVGLIADIAAIFKNHQISIDLLASSQTNFTVSLDPTANRLDDEVLQPLLMELRAVCRPIVIRPTASVSLVGTGLRALINQWARVVQCFGDEDLYLVAQGANDLSLCFVLNESGAGGLLRSIHRDLFEEDGASADVGPTWTEMMGTGE